MEPTQRSGGRKSARRKPAPDNGATSPERSKRISKKEQIVSLYLSGINDFNDLALLTESRPSYVASVLQQEGLVSGYFDLYTSTTHPMNVYSRYFAGRLGFKDMAAANASIRSIDDTYRRFERAGDRAGQHHALIMALTMFNRARWTGKQHEAEPFRRWLMDQLDQAIPREEQVGEQSR